MNTQQLAGMSNKINELKALFIFGQRVIPFLEELFNFVQEVIPLLDEINQSIQDSTSKMPRASSQLNKVTEATEMAATEIFDTVDMLMFKMGEMKGEHAQSSETIKKVVRIDAHILRLLRNELGDTNEVLLTKINQMHLEKLRTHKSLINFHDKMRDVLDEMHDSTGNIMMSMQVQDITTQQIAAVNHLIESVEDRLSFLINRFKNVDSVAQDDIPKAVKPLTFDPNATYDTSGSKQKFADEVFDKKPAQENAVADQSEIDKLFSGNAQPPMSTEKAEQSEIDKLFSGGDTVTEEPKPEKKSDSGSASQDEIDKLFGG